MDDESANDPIMQEALGHFFFATNAPALARALENLADNLESAGRAAYKLAAALAVTDGPVCFPSMIERRHRKLLLAHQHTWLRACNLDTLGIKDPQVRHVIRGIWTKAFLPPILDRTLRCASVQSLGNIRLIRLFGTMRPGLSSGPMLVRAPRDHDREIHGIVTGHSTAS